MQRFPFTAHTSSLVPLLYSANYIPHEGSCMCSDPRSADVNQAVRSGFQSPGLPAVGSGDGENPSSSRSAPCSRSAKTPLLFSSYYPQTPCAWTNPSRNSLPQTRVGGRVLLTSYLFQRIIVALMDVICCARIVVNPPVRASFTSLDQLKGKSISH